MRLISYNSLTSFFFQIQKKVNTDMLNIVLSKLYMFLFLKLLRLALWKIYEIKDNGTSRTLYMYIIVRISLLLFFFNVRLKVCSRNITVGVAQGSKLHLVTPSRSLFHACQILIHCHHLVLLHLVQKTG